METLKLIKIVKKRKQIGRGGKRGVSSGRGRGGQLSRSGGRSEIGVGFEGGQMPLVRRIPRRGFNRTMFKKDFEVINLDRLSVCLENFSSNVIGVSELRAMGLVRRRNSLVKLLGNGAISKAINLTVNATSQKAKEAVLAAGGTVSLV